MKQINVFGIQEGARFEMALFLPSGQKLLNAGVVINARHLGVLQNLSDTELYLATSVNELVEAGVVRGIDRQQLRAGQRATQDVLGAGGQIVLEQGQEIEAHHIEAMANGAFAGAPQTEADITRRRRDRMMLADASVEQLERDASTLVLRVVPASQTIWANRPAAPAAPWESIEPLLQDRAAFVEQVRQWLSRLEAGLPVTLESVQQLVGSMYDLLLNQPQRFPQLALLCPHATSYLADHSFCVAVLAMATAAHMNWPAADVKRIGTIALLYDIGMVLVPDRIRTGGCSLTDIDRQRIQRHPAYSLTLIEQVTGIDPILKLAAYQHHERETGVGYPVGVRADRICDYAKILAITDVFAAATGPRAYQATKLPYVAMEEIIRSAAAGIFDKLATRALVKAAGLFPIGSYVLLSTRQIAHVLAANPAKLDRPLIRLHTEDGQPTEQCIDLAIIPADKISIVRPAPAPKLIAA